MEMKNGYIKNLIGRMSLEQKIGAVLTLGFAGTVPRSHIYQYIEKYHCGGLRLSCDSRQFGSYVDPDGNKTVVKLKNDDGIRFRGSAPVPTASQYKAVLDELQTCARQRPLSIPLHFSYDQEGGSSADFFFGGVNLFPKPMGIRAMDDPEMAYRIAKAVAKQSKAVGFNWIHSPVLDVNSEPANPEIYTRAYSDDAGEVCLYVRETCRGLKEEKMIATGKHFPGRGASDVDAHFKVPVISTDAETLWERELLPYRELIGEGLLPSIMIAHSIFPAVDPDHIATVSKKVITGLLREKLGFEGVITTDSMTMGAIAVRYGVANACALALEAGADLVLMKAENHLEEEVIAAIRAFIEEGRIPMEEMDNKVYRILNLKYEYGLFGPEENTGAPEAVLQDPAVRELAKQAARRSVLIERSKEGSIPADGNRIIVIEQKVKDYNDMQWHSGILFEECLKYCENAAYLETSYSYDEEDRGRIEAALERFDVVIATNYFLRGKAGNRDFWSGQIERHPDKNIILVTNTPYEELSIPSNAQNVLLTFATSPENIKASAAVLFGQMKPEGVWPLRYRMPGGEKGFLICIDSDGCALDTMTIKHFRCFGPCLTAVWGLEEKRDMILKRWNEINLYSASRGINRFKALVQILTELEEAGEPVEGLDRLKDWTENTEELSEGALRAALKDNKGCPAMEKALEWSLLVNQRIARLAAEEKKAFPGVREFLAHLEGKADVAVVSSANQEAVEAEWKENGLYAGIKYVFAQNQGSKEACLRKLKELGYRKEKVLMVGDAPGDERAALENDVCFYPIRPGEEKESWKELLEEGIGRFLAHNGWKDYEREKGEQYWELLKGGRK
ncbi:MAG TPA: HAD hydrolase-like protein [Candidatus Eisenbergiella merdavium]|uniref:beta-N-acetylhexosaminidase n=1 Tax=Candidatus Eisenbergiella merdavium TaxID=2838551 RepID=A0A9D2NGX1_9FIRM|nr:HAD hydrolase-like protein [Candidatus Eisenbergiella merdavium]